MDAIHVVLLCKKVVLVNIDAVMLQLLFLCKPGFFEILHVHERGLPLAAKILGLLHNSITDVSRFEVIPLSVWRHEPLSWLLLNVVDLAGKRALVELLLCIE